ncbi:MAG: sialate O-acetylesterase [Planctomycetes bacterium]|nr:sialate O-acetylesterase [Planctomycetota bacterium]
MLAVIVLAFFAPPADKPLVRVIILAGQSNMEGQAVVDLGGRDYNQGKGTLSRLLENPDNAKRMGHLRRADGTWATRDDVHVRYKLEKGPVKLGPLGLGYTPYPGKHHFGPELQFGHVMGESVGGPILLVKTAWGGKSLHKDFRPPSSGGDTGPYYTMMIRDTREALAHLAAEWPESGKPELAGFVWYHGWNDGVDPKNAVPEYEQNLVNLILDIRKEFGKADLPVVVGELTGPWVKAPRAWDNLRKSQASATRRPEVGKSVVFVPTHDFVRPNTDSPNPGHGHHEFGNAETCFLVGDALGQAMAGLLKGK